MKNTISFGALSRVITSVAAFFYLLTIPALAEDSVGYLKGAFSVNEMGAAIYSIPLDLPPGINDMTPKVSINYSSQGGNGELGLGWSLSGFDSISRCPLTLEVDGDIDPVDYDNNDQFCLSGSRLVWDSSEGYYVDSNNGIVKAIPIGNVSDPQGGSSPTSWEVHLNNGNIAYYGARATGTSAAARIYRDATSTSIFSWKISELKDRFNNSIYYHYTENRAQGINVFDKITYGLNQAFQIKFNWESRSDRITSTSVGSSTRLLNSRINKISVLRGSAELMTYNITYEPSILKFSLIKAINKCSSTACLTPVTIDWDEFSFSQGNAFVGPSAYIGSGTDNGNLDISRLQFLDFNGDGITDIYRVNGWGSSANDDIFIFRPDGSYEHWVGPNTYVGSTIKNATLDINRIKFGDFNGDGIIDVFRVNGSGNVAANADVFLFNANGTYQHRQGPNIKVGSFTDNGNFDIGRLQFLDFNGDGITDVFRINGFGTVEPADIFLFQSDGTYIHQQGPSFYVGNSIENATVDINRIKFGDFNGDGLSDVFRINGSGSSANADVFIFGADGAYAPKQGPSILVGTGTENANFDLNRIRVQDFNGDGITDVYRINGWGSAQADDLFIFSSDATFVQKFGPNTYVGNSIQNGSFDMNRLRFADFNGDGLTDVFRINGSGSSAASDIFLLNADGTFTQTVGPVLYVGTGTDNGNFDISRLKFLDFNGDGTTDIYRANGLGTSVADDIFVFNADGTYAQKAGPVTYIGSSIANGSLDINRLRFGDFNGDGIVDVYRINGSNGTAAGSVFGNQQISQIGSFSDGQQTFLPRMELLSSTEHYSPGTVTGYPVVEIRIPTQIVVHVDQSDGIGGFNRTSYDYQGLKIHRRGLGLLGFEKIDATDEATGIQTVTNYSLDWENHTNGMVSSTRMIAANGVILSEAVIQLADHFDGVYSNRYLPFIKATTTIQRDLNGSVLNTTTKENFLNNDGFIEDDISCVTPDEMTSGEIVPCSTMPNREIHKVTNYSYYNKSFAPDFKALVHRKTTTITIPESPPYQPATETRVVEYDYYSTTGKVKYETLEPDSSTLWLKKAYTYHSTGQSLTETASGADIASRTETVVFDSSTKLPIQRKNALQHVTQLKYEDSRFPWMVTKVIAPDGNWTKTTLDSWGKVVRTEQGFGTTVFNWSTTDNRWCNGDALCDATNDEVSYIAAQTSTSQPNYIFFDQLGREVRKLASGLNNGLVESIEQRTAYDERGQVIWAGLPRYLSDATEYGTVTTFDDLGRPLTVTDPAQAISSILYNGRTVEYTDAKNHKKTVIKDGLGQQVGVHDNRNNGITYRYDAFGNLVYMVDPEGNETKIGYNIRGFKTAISDPDLGYWRYTYDASGQLVDQTDAKNQTTRSTYDLLGRLTSRTENWGTPQAATSNWYYDETNISATAVGKLTRTTNNRNYSETNYYDSYGRPYQTSTTIDGTGYTNSVTYDSNSRPKNATYPNGYVVQNRYHSSLGILEKVVSPDGDTNPDNDYTFWRIDSTDAAGNMNNATLGGIIAARIARNQATGAIESIRSTASWMSSHVYQDLAYTWDAVGNLETFDDLHQGVAEAYSYDDLYRLNDVVASNGINSSIRYDDLGNIMSKSGVGTYSYNEIAAPSECGANSSTPGPHALRRITGAKANYFCFDANGNLIKDNSRQIQYSTFNVPTQITKGATVVKFDYGPDRNRFKRVDTSGSSSTTTYTLGDYEKVTEGSVIKHKITIAGVAQVIQTQGQSITDINYFLKDHLGSLTAIINKYGTVLENMSYDAWGSRRLTNLTLLTNPYSYQNGITHRGFTGHEQVDSVGLIHMNGRVYDPIIGRFLSADPFVQAPSNLQSLNRYSYVTNNPLSMTDPSGFNWWKEVRRAVVTIATAVVGAIVGCLVGGPGGCLAGAGYGFAVGAAMGYSYRYAKDKGLKHHDALDGSAKAGATAFVTSYASNLAGGWLDKLDYGNSVVAEGVARVTTHALIGGAMAKVNGGKFADGAFVSGFRQLYSFGFAANTPVGSPTEHGFFSYAENAPLATLEQAAVSAAAAKMAGVSSSEAFRSSIANAVLASIFDNFKHDAQLGGGGENIAGDVIGKIWTSPNSIVGFALGGSGYLLGNVAYGIHSLFGGPAWARPTWSFGNNSLQFENNPLAVLGALTTGNVINYGGGLTPANVGAHEASHTYQGQILGPLYLPLNIVGQLASVITYPISSWRGPSPVHGKANFMETGPQSSPPRLWPWK